MNLKENLRQAILDPKNVNTMLQELPLQNNELKCLAFLRTLAITSTPKPKLLLL